MGGDVSLDAPSPEGASAGTGRAASAQSAEDGLHAGQRAACRGCQADSDLRMFLRAVPSAVLATCDPSHRGLQVIQRSSGQPRVSNASAFGYDDAYIRPRRA